MKRFKRWLKEGFRHPDQVKHAGGDIFTTVVGLSYAAIAHILRKKQQM
ncbi:hypothetical protein [Shouchella lonarensis]|uniref:Uncharacterized protein n=1 Tax=Shouchella lonarensis TaxID=1464122 RepID=A0A1G6NTI6_9BACI|nr:hypothetical protein [Shouchella lonarensis]SDC71310.1 hypothetical protein SAMN05421737_11372 [Shouchella lonarensis]